MQTPTEAFRDPPVACFVSPEGSTRLLRERGLPTPRLTLEKCPHVLNICTRFRNIYLTAIDYALRPRLRTD